MLLLTIGIKPLHGTKSDHYWVIAFCYSFEAENRLRFFWRVLNFHQWLFNQISGCRGVPFDSHKLGRLIDVNVDYTLQLFDCATNGADAAIA